METTSVIAEYVWLMNGEFKSKLRVLSGDNTSPISDPPVWSYNGNTTGTSDLILRPVATFKNPLQGKNSLLVLCEVYIEESGSLQPHISNTRYKASEIFQVEDYFCPQFKIKQEYYLLNPQDPEHPIGPPGKHHCGVGDTVIGRSLAEDHFKACLLAGLGMDALSAEAGQGQWHYSLGSCSGIKAADRLVISRYLLLRLSERGGIQISFHPKPFEDEPSSGAHINFSTIQTRAPGGYSEICKMIDRLAAGHPRYLDVCGEEYRLRRLAQFSSGQDSRDVLIRIPRETVIKQCGHFQDRRPNSNMDPYSTTARLFEQACLQPTV